MQKTIMRKLQILQQ